MKKIKYLENEKKIKSAFPIGLCFTHKNTDYKVLNCGKAESPAGEPKTDIYLDLSVNNNFRKEIKISYKKTDADFLENKIRAERAKQIFGENWELILSESTGSIKKKFENRKLIFYEKKVTTEAKKITLGWKFELMNKTSGELSGQMQLTGQQKEDVYAGSNLSSEYKDSYVNGKKIKDSGIANFILIEDDVNEITAHQILEGIIPIKEFIKNTEIYFACKALNYRAIKDTWDGDRPLAVHVDWNAKGGLLTSKLVFDKPLQKKGNEIGKKLQSSLEKLNISSTNFDDLRDIYRSG